MKFLRVVYLREDSRLSGIQNEWFDKKAHQNAVNTTNFTFILSHNLAVIQWITSCRKNHMTRRVITFWRVYVTSLTTSVSAMHFLLEILSISQAIKSNNKQNLTLVVIYMKL